MADQNFKVVIVGGGVIGLSLANMLQQFDIEYVLLESHGDVAPQVGASIGMLPNGLRILDQIGCYQRVVDLPQQPILMSNNRDSKGKTLLIVDKISEKIQER
jgi:2-polyprenyl-6-methoxyphenol hydroxylase-like FAD-dependent oxidoreductase